MLDWKKLAQDLAPWAIPIILGTLVHLWRKLRDLVELPAAVAALSRRNRLTLDVARLTLYHVEGRHPLAPQKLHELRDKVDDLRDEFWEMEGHEPMRPHRTLMIDAGPLREILRRGKK